LDSPDFYKNQYFAIKAQLGDVKNETENIENRFRKMLTDHTEDKNVEIQNLKEEIENRKNEIENQKEEIENQKKEIENEKKEIENQKTEIENEKKEIENQKKEIENQKKDIENQKEEIENQKKFWHFLSKFRKTTSKNATKAWNSLNWYVFSEQIVSIRAWVLYHYFAGQRFDRMWWEIANYIRMLS